MIYYLGGSLPDDKDDIKEIREKYTPEAYNNSNVNIGDALGLCLGAIKQIADRLDKIEERIGDGIEGL